MAVRPSPEGSQRGWDLVLKGFFKRGANPLRFPALALTGITSLGPSGPGEERRE